MVIVVFMAIIWRWNEVIYNTKISIYSKKFWRRLCGEGVRCDSPKNCLRRSRHRGRRHLCCDSRLFFGLTRIRLGPRTSDRGLAARCEKIRTFTTVVFTQAELVRQPSINLVDDAAARCRIVTTPRPVFTTES